MDWKDVLLPGATRTPLPYDGQLLPGWVNDFYGTPTERADWVRGPGGAPVISGSSEAQPGAELTDPFYTGGRSAAPSPFANLNPEQTAAAVSNYLRSIAPKLIESMKPQMQQADTSGEPPAERQLMARPGPEELEEFIRRYGRKLRAPQPFVRTGGFTAV